LGGAVRAQALCAEHGPGVGILFFFIRALQSHAQVSERSSLSRLVVGQDPCRRIAEESLRLPGRPPLG